MKNEETTTGSAIGSHSPSDGVTPFEPCGKIGGSDYFTCDSNTFNAARLGRSKGQRWNTFLKADNQFSNDLRHWARKNGNPDIMLKDASSGVFMYAQKGISKR